MTVNPGKMAHIALGFISIALALVSGATLSRTVTYYYTDVQGTPLAMTDASGNVIKLMDRSPFGRLLLGGVDPIGMAGHVADEETSLVYMQARFYDPEVGRFLSVDPVAPLAAPRINLQRYTYVDNNPFTFKDPSGRLLHADQPDFGVGCGRGECDKQNIYRDVELGVLDDYIASRSVSWLKSLWRGQAAHRVIERDIKDYANSKGIEAQVEESFVTADGGRLRIDVMMRRGPTEAWSLFEIKPGNPRAAMEGFRQVGNYVAEMQRVDMSSKPGTWSEFFSTSYRDVHEPSIVIGRIDFGGTYVYGPDENWRGVITYQTADSPISP